jgi:polysaccharide pyruvyl transferase CsaB
MRKILISGYYGFGNIGDEAILASTVAAFRAKDPDIEITALSQSPEITSRSYNIRALPRMSLFGVLGAIRETQVTVFGGGSLLQDSTSFRSLAYYLSILFLCHLFKTPVVVYANGIGPLKSTIGKYLTRLALSGAREITVRDEESLDALRSIGLKRPVKVTADPAFLLDPVPNDRTDEILRNMGVSGSPVWFALRPGKAPEEFYRSLVKSALGIRSQGLEPCLMVMQERDLGLVQYFNQQLSELGEEPVPWVSGLSPAEALGVLQRGKFCVGMRLHTLILSARAGVPFLGVEIDPKIGAFCRMTCCPVLPNPNSTAYDAEKAVYSLAKNRVSLARNLKESLPRFISLAAENVDIVLSVLDSTC